MPRAAAKVEEKAVVEAKPDMTDMFVSRVKQRVVAGGGMHVLRFEANVPQRVPKNIQTEMLNFGILPVEGDPPMEEVKEVVEKPDPQGHERSQLIAAAMVQLAERNQSVDFSAGGVPTMKALEKKLGFKITTKERDDLWKTNRRAAAEAREG